MAITVIAVPAAGCGDEENSQSANGGPAVAYVDDRGPGAQTAPSRRLSNGTFDDPIADGNPAVQAEEVVRDYQESLAEGSGTGACRELSERLQRRLAKGGDCSIVLDASATDRGGDFYRPSKILTVDLGNVAARVTVQDGDRQPFAVVLRLTESGTWALTDVDLGSPTGLRPAAGTRGR